MRSRSTASPCLPSVLQSDRAVQMSILIVSRLRQDPRASCQVTRDLAARVEKLETSQKRHTSVINILAEEIDAIKKPPAGPKAPDRFSNSGCVTFES